MKNEATMRPFPDNLFYDLGAEPPKEQSEDFFGTFLYVLRTVTSARDSRAILLRYKEGKTFDEIGNAMGISKQRASALINDILAKITGNHVQMLAKGLKKYYEDLFADRINAFPEIIEQSCLEEVKREAYADGYKRGYEDGGIGREKTAISIDSLNKVSIDTVKLSVRSHNALSRNGVRSLGDLVRKGDTVMNFRNFGKGCFFEIAEILKGYSVSITRHFPKAVMKFDWSDKDE